MKLISQIFNIKNFLILIFLNLNSFADNHNIYETLEKFKKI